MNVNEALHLIETTEDTAFLGEAIKAALARRKSVNDEIRARRAELKAEQEGLKLRHRKPRAAAEPEPEPAPKKKKKKNREA